MMIYDESCGQDLICFDDVADNLLKDEVIMLDDSQRSEQQLLQQ